MQVSFIKYGDRKLVQTLSKNVLHISCVSPLIIVFILAFDVYLFGGKTPSIYSNFFTETEIFLVDFRVIIFFEKIDRCVNTHVYTILHYTETDCLHTCVCAFKCVYRFFILIYPCVFPLRLLRGLL